MGWPLQDRCSSDWSAWKHFGCSRPKLESGLHQQGHHQTILKGLAFTSSTSSPHQFPMFPMDVAEDKDGLPRKVVGTSVVAVVDFGEEGGQFVCVLCAPWRNAVASWKIWKASHVMASHVMP